MTVAVNVERDAQGYWTHPTLFMVRRLNHCFKNVLTMNIGFRSPVIAGSHATYDDKIQFLAHF